MRDFGFLKVFTQNPAGTAMACVSHAGPCPELTHAAVLPMTQPAQVSSCPTHHAVLLW